MVGDLFGLKNLGTSQLLLTTIRNFSCLAPLHARQLSAVLPAAYLGPKVVTSFRESYARSSIEDLATKVDNDTFFTAFGATKDHIPQMIEQKTITSNSTNSDIRFCA